MSKSKEQIITLSFNFFSNMLKDGSSFSLTDISDHTGWSVSTVRTYRGKKWDEFLVVESKGRYKVDAAKFKYTLVEYIRFMSQVQKYSREPSKPVLDEQVNILIQKSRESAILAIDTYNRPATSFRTQGFIVLMIIAWTSLLHAIFENDGVDYYYKENDGSYKMIDGDKKAWELSTSIIKYQDISDASRKNLELFILLRNKIEHRFLPQLDIEVYGECQAMLLNYEDLIVNKFGNYYSLNETLSIPLQVVRSRTNWQSESIGAVQKIHYDELKKFLYDYRRDLPDNVYTDMNYSFRVYLVAKTGNHKGSSDIAMEFIKFDPENPQEYAELEKNITLIKEKTVQVANHGKYKPKSVVEEVARRINKHFTINLHTKAWKFYKVRTSEKSSSGCKSEYCHYDVAHNDYVYTEKWIDFLADKLTDENEYNNLKMYKE